MASVTAQNILASKEFEAKNASSVSINGRFCDVEIRNGSKVYFKGIIEGRGDEGDYEIQTGMVGSELVVKVINNRRSWDGSYRGKLELTVPDGVRVEVDNSSGDIYAVGLTADEYRFESTSGDIELTDIKANLDVESTSGDVELENIIGEINSESTSGDQDINGFSGSLDIESTSGDIEITDFEGEVIAGSTSGNVDVARGAGMLRLRATSGNIEGYGIELTGDSEFRTSSGNIEMEFTNGVGALSFDLQASSGSLSVGSRRSEKSLYMKQGGFWIKGVSSSGNQRYR